MARFIVNPPLQNKKVLIIPQTQKSNYTLIMTSISLRGFSPDLWHFASDFSPGNLVKHDLTEKK